MKEFKKPELLPHEMRGTTLGKIHEKEEKPSLVKPFFLIALIFLGIFISVEAVLHYLSPEETKDQELTTNLSLVTTTTSSLAITTSTSLLTTTTPSSLATTTLPPANTTTLECGSDWEPPCENETGQECDLGYELGSEGLCHEVECAPSVPSGKEGCGGWALEYCQ